MRNYVRHRAVAYHLYHRSRAPTGNNPFDRLLEETLRTRATRCVQGLDAHLAPLDPPGLATRLEAGKDLILQIHFHNTTGADAEDWSRFALHLAQPSRAGAQASGEGAKNPRQHADLIAALRTEVLIQPIQIEPGGLLGELGERP